MIWKPSGSHLLWWQERRPRTELGYISVSISRSTLSIIKLNCSIMISLLYSYTVQQGTICFWGGLYKQ
ncbi:hypothetical protein XELAEV_18033974mg [Xenopus laevis]|uniref:Uncharacterized protein n=1 Tax=Xenopus laevis TaxID=8355 RepID=A0A974CLL8_XENLA|nr:hypothetical protein XELAEV_18033974mg [Xenopus laevis]